MKSWAMAREQHLLRTGFQALKVRQLKTRCLFEPNGDGGAIERFSGDAMAQQEPDASASKWRHP